MQFEFFCAVKSAHIRRFCLAPLLPLSVCAISSYELCAKIHAKMSMRHARVMMINVSLRSLFVDVYRGDVVFW